MIFHFRCLFKYFRHLFKQILAACRETQREVREMNANLTAAVNTAVALINAQGVEISNLKAQLAAVVDDSAAEQAEADKLNAVIAANPIPA